MSDTAVFNVVKLVVVAVIVVAAIVGLVLGLDPTIGTAILTAALGYVGGNAKFTSRTGNVAPIIDTKASA